MRRAQQYGSKPLTRAEGLLAFKRFLASASDAAVLGMTIDRALLFHNMDPREGECAMLAAQNNRRREIADRGAL